MIIVIDYGMGNLNSVKKALLRIKANVLISSNYADILKADKLILPGVGNFKLGMHNLKKLGYLELLNELVLDKKKPILGICLGMQLLTSYSEEGGCDGLNWIPGKTIKFKKDLIENRKLHIPHIGWNTIKFNCSNNNLLKSVKDNSSLYFVHSYYVLCNNKTKVIATTEYGLNFDSVIACDNIMGTQFHPEKSHHVGLKILENFIKL